MGKISGLKLKETFFVSHLLPPSWCIDDNIPPIDFLKSFQKTVFKIRPSAILFISAHWHTTYPTVYVSSSGINDIIYDFNGDGFHECIYQIKYPAPGAPEVAKRVKQLLMASAAFEQVDEDQQHGLDYSVWLPLLLMYPEADIPVCQLSIQPEKDATYHYNLGKALSPLKDEGVLIFGTGGAIHNFMDPESLNVDGSVTPWAAEFYDWLKQAILDGRYEDVNKYEEKAPHAKVAHPTPDHFYPLHVAIGAAGEYSKAEIIYDGWSTATTSDASFKFTQQE